MMGLITTVIANFVNFVIVVYVELVRLAAHPLLLQLLLLFTCLLRRRRKDRPDGILDFPCR